MTTVIQHRDFRPFKSRPFDPKNPHGVVEDGEALSFDVMFRDAAGKPTSAVYLTDTSRIARDADRSRALAAYRFSDGAKLHDLPEGSTRAISGSVSADTPVHDAGGARASIDALRHARYR